MVDGGVRVRFAPSPTGYLHIGGVRTALYSWLWARQNGGAFVLRIEDTDQERSTEQSVNVVLESMRWLGLGWDEGPDVGGPHGPYRQSERGEVYRDHAERLIASGHAYRCYATKEDIAAARAAYDAQGHKGGFRFESPWRDPATAPAPPSADAPSVVRFRAPVEGSTAWDDLVRGRIEVRNDTLQDAILLRSDGLPLYNFGCVVDDLTMGVTLVARGDDHIINTPPQILLYEALGAPPPTFAHMPMVLAPNGEKLSKRHAAVGVLEYRDLGYLPDALLNSLARLWWSHGAQEIFTRDELVAKFDWRHVGATAGKYDLKKLEYVQAEHLRALPPGALAAHVVPFLAKLGLEVSADDPRLLAASAHVKLRCATLVELADGLRYFFEPPRYEDKPRRKFLTPASGPVLRGLGAVVRDARVFEPEALEAAVKAWSEAEGLKLRDVAQPARVALTGRAASPGLFDVMAILGRDETLVRIETGAAMAEAAPPTD